MVETLIESGAAHLILGRGERRYIMGQASIIVKRGTIHVLGKHLNQTDKSRIIISPISNALLFIENISPSEVAEVILGSVYNGLEKMYLSNGGNVLGLTNDSKATFALNPPREHQVLDIPHDWFATWDLISDNEFDVPIVLVCGPRKVGKSTLCRFLANQFLNQREIAYIDLDPGQTEFMPPGFAVLNLISEPLLGPPMGHTGATTHSRYIGFTGVDNGPMHYYNCAKDLIELYKEQFFVRKLPLIINTMGWVTGLGFILLQAIVKTIRPTHVIAIRSEPSQDKSEIPNYVDEALYMTIPTFGLKLQPFGRDERVKRIALNPIGSSSGEAERARISPKERRDLVWMAYFHRNHEAGYNLYDFEKCLTAFKPYAIPWERITILINPIKGKLNLHSMFALLTNTVIALAEETPPCEQDLLYQDLRIRYLKPFGILPECRAAAMIRSVDPRQKRFEILTPHPITYLFEHHLYTLVIHPGFHFPSQLILRESQNFPSAPYLSAASSFSGPLTNHTRKSQSVDEGNETRKQKELQMAQQEQMRSAMLSRILTAEARERLSRIAMVKPDKARGLEDLLINAARCGQLRGSSPQGQITELDLVGLLERINKQEYSTSENKIKFHRRTMIDDDDF